MTRVAVVAALVLALLAAPLAAEAQQPRIYRVGILTNKASDPAFTTISTGAAPSMSTRS